MLKFAMDFEYDWSIEETKSIDEFNVNDGWHKP